MGVDAAYVAQEPDHLVDEVAAQVAKQPSARSGLERCRVVEVEAGVHPPQLPQPAAPDDGCEGADVGVPAPVVEHRQQQAGGFGRGRELTADGGAMGAKGLSAMTWTPAASASSTSSRRVSGGVVIVTASTPLASSRPRLSKTGTPGQSCCDLGPSHRRTGDHTGQLDALGCLDERRVEVPPADAVPDDAQPQATAAAPDFASSYDARPLSDPGTPVSHQAPASVQVAGWVRQTTTAGRCCSRAALRARS